MTTMSPETTGTGPNPTSYDDGYTEGELAAITQLPAARAMARAAMADQYDPFWAQGYADGYLNQIQATYTLAQQDQAV